MSHSSRSQRTGDWLNALGSDFAKHQIDFASEITAPGKSLKPDLKRRVSAMEGSVDLTPRAKKHCATGLKTPSLTSMRVNSVKPALPYDEAQSSPSSEVTSSRSSSPSKRQREAQTQFSQPALDFLPRSDSKRWKDSNTDTIPLLKELLNHISNYTTAMEDDAQTIPNIDSKLSKILQEVEKCKDRSATEEMWSDTVVLPALRLARKTSRYNHSLDVINL